MSLTLAEIKDLVAYGQELGLQSLQAAGVTVVYGQRAVMQPSAADVPSLLGVGDSETLDITQHYALRGKGQLKP